MAKSEQPRRRFAPVHIETTFESVRRKTVQSGPAPELTPEPSPRSPSPIPDELQDKRKFAPQLIETSRRARRLGDAGPATKPADKTDITPYTNHIYISRSKSRRRMADESQLQRARRQGGARRESEDETFSGYLLELAALEVERQMEEDALAAFPNSRAREGGVAHFYFRESSGDDTTPESTSPPDAASGTKLYHGFHPRVLRRKSSDLGYWHKHMQEHAEQLARERGEASPLRDDGDDDHNDSDLDKMDLPGPPDAMWLTNTRNQTKGSSIGSYPGPKGPIGESFMPLIQSDPYITSESHMPYIPPPSPVARPIGETYMPYIPSAPPGRAADMPYVTSSQIPPETGFRNAGGGGYGGGFGGFGGFNRPYDFSGGDDRELKKMRNAASPPMLGKDLTFRTCPSPKHTKLEPDHPFTEGLDPEEQNRDVSGHSGLWRGYCYRSSVNEEDIVPPALHGPKMLATPLPPSTPSDPFAVASGKQSLSEEPASHSTSSTLTPSTAEHRLRSGDAKGLFLLHGLEDRLKREKAIVEREEKIAAEFDDQFITQVYNYLSLGYPATARVFDDELSKISRISVATLEQNDEKMMATGHMLEQKNEDKADEDKCPRWKALKIYIYEWAWQHPDLDGLDPLAWGVRERRGSWAI